jgi:diguanylate cyclase (GGDEF)-like protein
MSASYTDTRKVLLIGDIGRAFLDADAVREFPCQVHSDILDGIEAASKNNFKAIGVVMFGLSSQLSSGLKALREADSNARIILLAEMYEEPMAMRLIGSAFNGAGVADDYLICPIQAKSFWESLIPSEGQVVVEETAPAGVDTSIEAKLKHLEKLATEDDLTGLKNRRYIWEFSRQIIKRAEAGNGRVTLLIFDIDDFKHYNDVYGHSAGDEILRQAAVLMRRCCRRHDVVGRVGGDEFAVVFWDDPQLKSAGAESERRSAMADHPTEAIFVAKRFRREFNKAELHLLGPEGKGVLTISGGLASFPRDGSTIEELFGQADEALLEAKRSGKDRIYLVGSPQSDIADIE